MWFGIGFSAVLGLATYSFLFYGLWRLYQQVQSSSVRSKVLMEGQNNNDDARRYLEEDLKAMKESLVTFTDSAEDWFWGADENDSIRRLLEEKAQSGVQMTFFVSEGHFKPEEAKTVCGLAQRMPDSIRILILPERPGMDFRLVDGRRLYMTHHTYFGDGEKRRKFWRSNRDLPPIEQRAIYARIGEQAARMRPFTPTRLAS